ncbi:TadE/TadG family type IV pilus assembly protein [Aliivibrio kagoshimensis]|uniref:pilus assembly protein n=1 Tax=Aliivibrio kagoshimensis TaxID=2910230 RepID=UPI003D0D1131
MKKAMTRRSASKANQSGHAIMLFVMIVPALFSLFVLASDGARILQTKARIGDASEVASLAIAAHNDENSDDGSGSGSSKNQEIVTNVVSQYMTDMNSITGINVRKLVCEDLPDCTAGLNNGDSRYFEYRVTVSTEHTPWFPGNNVHPSFGDSFEVNGFSASRKYQSDSLDIVFAADFTGSMTNDLGSSGQDKYKALREIIMLIADELDKFNQQINTEKSKIGIAPFSTLTNSYRSGRDCYVDQLILDRVWDPYRREWRYTPNYNKTLAQVFTEKTDCMSRASARVKDVKLTSNFSRVETDLYRYSPGGTTATYQGIIRAAQLVRDGDNPKRLVVVLSDGRDSTSREIRHNHKAHHNQLISMGYCDKIREELNQDVTPEGKDITAKLVIIGFDYNANADASLINCAGAENVFSADNKQEVLDKILELIAEEIGHLT